MDDSANELLCFLVWPRQQYGWGGGDQEAVARTSYDVKEDFREVGEAAVTAESPVGAMNGADILTLHPRNQPPALINWHHT